MSNPTPPDERPTPGTEAREGAEPQCRHDRPQAECPICWDFPQPPPGVTGPRSGPAKSQPAPVPGGDAQANATERKLSVPGGEDHAAAMAKAGSALLHGLGEYIRQSMHDNPEWRSGVREMEAAIRAYYRSVGGPPKPGTNFDPVPGGEVADASTAKIYLAGLKVNRSNGVSREEAYGAVSRLAADNATLRARLASAEDAARAQEERAAANLREFEAAMQTAGRLRADLARANDAHVELGARLDAAERARDEWKASAEDSMETLGRERRETAARLNAIGAAIRGTPLPWNRGDTSAVMTIEECAEELHRQLAAARATLENNRAAHGATVVERDRLAREREELADLLGDMANTDCNCGDCLHCKARRYVVHECHDGDCNNDRLHDCHSSSCKEGQPFVMHPARADFLAVATALGIVYEADGHAVQAGPRDAVVAAAKEAQAAREQLAAARLDLGLAEIRERQARDLLASCERALAERDATLATAREEARRPLLEMLDKATTLLDDLQSTAPKDGDCEAFERAAERARAWFDEHPEILDDSLFAGLRALASPAGEPASASGRESPGGGES